MGSGGKGANQAVAAAKLDAEVQLIARVSEWIPCSCNQPAMLQWSYRPPDPLFEISHASNCVDRYH